MWIYEKRLQYPVNIKKTCPKTASLIISQFVIFPNATPCHAEKQRDF